MTITVREVKPALKAHELMVVRGGAMEDGARAGSRLVHECSVGAA